jgi:hypothetical protein
MQMRACRGAGGRRPPGGAALLSDFRACAGAPARQGAHRKAFLLLRIPQQLFAHPVSRLSTELHASTLNSYAALPCQCLGQAEHSDRTADRGPPQRVIPGKDERLGKPGGKSAGRDGSSEVHGRAHRHAPLVRRRPARGITAQADFGPGAPPSRYRLQTHSRPRPAYGPETPDGEACRRMPSTVTRRCGTWILGARSPGTAPGCR